MNARAGRSRPQQALHRRVEPAQAVPGERDAALRRRAGRRWLAALLLAASASGHAQSPAAGQHAAALQACPTIKNEIVDLDMLAKGLEHSRAVGLIEKLRLKSAIDELLGRLKSYHGGAGRFTLAQLQEQYDVLMMRIATQLQDKDATLHGKLCNAWDSIWATLQDRKSFLEKMS